MRITTKELRQLLKDLAEEEPDQRAVLLRDRYNHFKDSNPDIIERLLKIAWDHVMTYRPPWDTNGITYGWVKQTVPFMRQKGITPREIVRIHCENHQLYNWALPFHPDLLKIDLDKKDDLHTWYRKLYNWALSLHPGRLKTDQDKKEDLYTWCRKDLTEALDAFNASYEERISYLGALEEVMEYAYSADGAIKEKVEGKETFQSAVISMPMVALQYALEGKRITEESGKTIAREYGWESKKSGHKLYLWFLKYSRPDYRKARPDNFTKRTLNNKIKLFESVINMLSAEGKERAKDNLRILKAYIHDLE